MNCRMLIYPLFAIIGCQFESNGMGDPTIDEQGSGGLHISSSAETGGTPSQGGFRTSGGTSSSVATGGTTIIPTQSGGSASIGGASSIGGTHMNGGVSSTGGTASGGIMSTGGESVSTGGTPIQTGGSPATGGIMVGSGDASLLPPCDTRVINEAQRRIATGSSSYTSSFDIKCSFKQAMLEVTFDGDYGPNYETPPIITLSNPSRTQSINTALFMPPISSDDCWSIKPDGSHDYNCAFSVASDVTGTLAQGNNTVYIVGKQGDTFTFTDIRITF